ncbi:MAG TPA: hypothetical protein VGR35_09580 [Tepidisphaeraceae bacterium]|nr:hypothetical protein [Tepidisphaeraceae bacterium]
MVISVRERFQNRRSSFRDGVKTHQREWLVTCDNGTDGTAVALTANDGTRRIPPENTLHPQDLSARLTSLEADPHQGSDRHFLVKGEYTGTGLMGLPPNPLDRPPEISYSYTEFTKPYFMDRSKPDPKPVVNTAGDPFEQYLERDDGELVINITINEPTFDVLAMDELKHTKNEGICHIDGTSFAPGTLKVSAPSAQRIIENIEGEGGTIQRFKYYRVTYVVKARKKGWDDEVLSYGLSELVPDPKDPLKPKRLRPIWDGTSQSVRKPWPLDAEGKRMPNPFDKPATQTFVPYDPMDWSNIRAFKAETWQE